ncbi:MAG: hypothetical protein UHH87_05555 [Akkermansia sp.]|nr:hypothetical protein [Akkermansia sp.]
MRTSRASRKIADQHNKPQLKIHKIVSASIELGCTNDVGISRSLLIEHLAQKYGDSEQKWENRVAQTFSEDNKEYGQYFCKDGEQLTFHPDVWQEIVRVGWVNAVERTAKAGDKPISPAACSLLKCEDSPARFIAGNRASVNIAAWGTFALEVIGSAASDKNKTGYFRSDVGVARLKAAVESGATFLFVHVSGSITRAFAISAYALHRACSERNVSINNNGTPRYELYINYRKGEICKNAGPDGFVVAFDNIVNS